MNLNRSAFPFEGLLLFLIFFLFPFEKPAFALATCQLEALAKSTDAIKKSLYAQKHEFPENCKSKAAQEKYIKGYQSADELRAPSGTPDEYLGCWNLFWNPARKVERLPKPAFCESLGHAKFKEDFVYQLRARAWQDTEDKTSFLTCNELKDYGRQIAYDQRQPQGTKGKAKMCIEARKFFYTALSGSQFQKDPRVYGSDAGAGPSHAQVTFRNKIADASPAMVICAIAGYEEGMNRKDPEAQPPTVNLRFSPEGKPSDGCCEVPKKEQDAEPAKD